MMNEELLTRALRAAGFAPPSTRVSFTGHDPVFPSPLHLGSGMAAAFAMVGSAIDDIWHSATGRRQHIEIDLTHAALFLSSMWLLRFNGEPATASDQLGALPVEGVFRCADDRWISISCVFPALTQGTLEVLDCEPDPVAVRAAIARRNSFELEQALTARDLSGVVIRSVAEWLDHPQALAMRDQPVVVVERIGDAPVTALPRGERPLTGLRVLELTRVLAGPTVSRTLAEFGADVLQVTAPHLPDLTSAQADTGHGKRRTFLDLDRAEDKACLMELAAGADVFSQSFRSGRLANRGLSPEALARHRPGIIYVSENCYGHRGPWVSKRGYDSNVRAAAGVLRLHERPGDAPDPDRLHFALHDYGTGLWGAYGVLLALQRRATEGGSWHVRISLNQTALWHLRLGLRHDERRAPPHAELKAAFHRYSEQVDSSYGSIERLRPVLRMSATSPAWDQPTLKPGESRPHWLAIS